MDIAPRDRRRSLRLLLGIAVIVALVALQLWPGSLPDPTPWSGALR